MYGTFARLCLPFISASGFFRIMGLSQAKASLWFESQTVRFPSSFIIRISY